MDTVERPKTAAADRAYDGFISYSHAADDLLAPRLQSGLQRFAKPWWKRRALRIFRDESSLSANPHLWSSITEALDESSWFVLLVSPDAANSEWVNQEIEYWKEHKDPSRILPVLTDGTFEWTDGDVSGTAAPEQLRGAFTEEPRWVDLRFAKEEDQLNLKNPRFADAVADIASALRGVPKDELASEEVKQHRRSIRTAWAGAALVTALAFVATIFGFQSARNADEAERQATIAEENAAEAQTQRDAALAAEDEAQRQARLARARELGAASVEALDSDPRLARILALEAIDVTANTGDIPGTVVNALWRSISEDRLVNEIETGLAGFTPIVLSEDGSRFVLSSDEGKTVVVYSAPDAEELWRYTDPLADLYGIASISPDGSRVAVGVVNRGNPDAKPTRVMILDGNDGSVLEEFEYPDCPSMETWGWSPDGSTFVSNHGFEPCPRDEAPGGIWAEVRDAITWESLAVIASDDPWVAEPIFDSEGNLYIFGIESPVKKYTAEAFAQIAEFDEAYGLGDVSPDGSLLATYTPSRSVGLRIVDTESGAVVDSLTPLPGTPLYGIGIRFSSDGSELAVATEDKEAVVWGTEIGQRLHVLPTGPSNSIVLSPDSRWIYTSHPGGTIRIWDRGPRSVNTSASGDLGDHPFVNGNSFNIGQEIGTAQAVDPDGDCVPFCSRIRLFDLETGSLTEPSTEGFNAQPMPDGTIGIQSADESWHLFDPVTGATEALPECFPLAAGGCLDMSQTPRIGVMVSIDGSEVAIRRIHERGSETLSVMDPLSWHVIDETDVDFRIVAFSDEWILGARDSLEVVVVERGTGAEISSAPVSTGMWEVSPAGSKAAVMTFEGDIALIEFGTWTPEVFNLDIGQVRGMGFSPDDTRIALGDQTELHIFDFEQGLITQTIPIPGVSDIYWLDDETIVIGTTDGLWATVSLALDDLIEAARTVPVPREFTVQECATYRIEPCPTADQDG